MSSQAAISIENSKLYVRLTSKNIELMIAHEQLQQRVAEIDLLFHIEQEMNRQVALDGFLQSLLCRARNTIAAEAGVALIREGSRWRIFSHHGDGDDALTLSTWPEDTDGRLVELATRAEGYLQNHIDGAFDPRLGEILGVPIRSVLLVPLEIAGQRLGALLLVNKEGIPQGLFDEADRKMLTVIGGRAEVAIVLAQQRAEELNQSRLSAIGQALSGVLHDLRTPMTIIGGYTQLMVDEEDPKERAEYAQTVSRQLKQLKGMTQEILAFARGESSLLVRKVFLHTFIPEVVAGLEEEMRGRDITVEIELGYRDGIRMDVGKMQRVLFNLARNARQAMEEQEGPQRFRIETALDEAKDEVLLTLSDTGPGIPEDIRETLFDSFVTSGKKDGTGLGLAIVKKIVEQHGGTVGFRSKPGQGTTFDIRLPRNL